jgi:phage shock protein E
MDWPTWPVVGGFIPAFLIFKRLALVAPAKARETLKAGAIVMDVRSEAEFKKGHLPKGLNIPSDRLGEDIARRAPDMSRLILLYCLSGGRSGIGRSMLKRQRYLNVFNLGSYARAKKIIGSSQ